MSTDILSPGAQVITDSDTGAPRKIKGDIPLAGDRAASGLRDDGSAQGDIEKVKAMLETYAKDLMLPEGGLRYLDERRTPQRRVMRYQEEVDGVPVFNGTVKVQLGTDGNIKQIDFERLAAAPSVAPGTPGDSPPLSPEEALAQALKELGNPELRLDPALPAQVYFPHPDGLRLAYRAEIATRDPHDWIAVLDARSGKLLHKEDMIKRADGRGLVFDPNPVVTAKDATLRDPAATLAQCGFDGTPLARIDAERVERPLRDISFVDGAYRLVGPYVAIVDFKAPEGAVPSETTADGFKYSSSDGKFSAVNVYYHVDTIQRYIQSIGIIDANNRQVSCDAYDSIGAGAWYSPMDKGLHFSDSGLCRPARAHDGDCILHEYGHAIQDDQVPYWGQRSPVTQRDETRAMGEGFGDILACAFFSPLSDFEDGVFEDWIFGDNGGLRRVDGSKTYPDDWLDGREHENGEIWSGALWEIFKAIGGANDPDARRAARDDLLKALITSHVLVPANGTMTDGAEALLTAHAEVDPEGGKHLATMREILFQRGLLRVSNVVADAENATGKNFALSES